MREELKKAIGLIHSNDYEKLKKSEKVRKLENKLLKLKPVTYKTISKKDDNIFAAFRSTRNQLITLGVIISIAVIYMAINNYNQFSRAVVTLAQHKSLVQNELQRRKDLIPNLILISNKYSSHEKILLNYVSEMRTQLAGLNKQLPSAMGTIEPPDSVKQLMSKLLAISEQYPDLKATQSFERVMNDWTQTENRIAASRENYIESIRHYNRLCTTFPTNIYGFFYGYETKKPFDSDEQSKQPLNFSKLYTPGKTGSMERKIK